ncbi:MAG: hydroxymethylbilane synthase [Janthinobacterium lividum]
MSTPPIRIGTRGSQLALWQANHIAEELRHRGHSVMVEVIRTTGDRMQDPTFVAPATFDDGTPLDAKGIFIKEIEDALLDGRIDVAVHSLKDLPTTLDPRFTLAAIPARADARDAFVCEEFWGLHMLPMGARVATTSPRRQAMLLALRPDLRFVEMRGNIDTRLRKWAAGEADALILASAGLDRLRRTEHVHQRFAVDEICPAPGQGALGLEVLSRPATAASGDGAGRNNRHDVLEALRQLNDADASFATSAERTVLAALGGGCNLPLGAYCHASDGRWHMHAMVAAPDGDAVIHVLHTSPFGIEPQQFGEAVAEDLRSRGARELLNGVDALDPAS